ncbi:pseudouridine synthase [Ignatzschineria cameli]|uniref:Ribosomal small subunit pseudouridine synthase A n=1 Tax=Ignatzschineria cameli TaxID=2182793 RepID=A0A2U2AQ58_9GAMM|nr:pseudouridine synthase [Ignatzschineria cameli]PWD82905.1 16S rRNA pseudouridine(516) synthase [Ignatzschineria cameli]PWD85753.1 16S rRNA pseudouridine(516) synthase [Ignatzschineria cameli]PWD89382.1 16S rRNA pseudouridine(516) synthase [Ignatzschineria cameli]PWD90854.1 16S rRNA pseudouridine(516) synthase [Ignatzschineria cameli]PWD91642.1 16S rRNA pseudouridine(516) synthase [Ignatzschineria cameli]
MAEKGQESYRLDQYLQLAMEVSRKEAGKIIRNGWITVNGEEIRARDFKVSESDQIEIDGEPLIYSSQPRYFMLYKPAGYVSSHRHDGHISLFKLLENERALERLHIAGRLDADTTGMVLITDDGAWSHRVTHPTDRASDDIEKVYEIELARLMSSEMVAQLEAGVELRGDDLITKPAKVEILSEREIRLTLTEGRYHQVKRMLAAVGNHVERLHRSQIGHLTLDGLREGEYRPLTEAEIKGF